MNLDEKFKKRKEELERSGNALHKPSFLQKVKDRLTKAVPKEGKKADAPIMAGASGKIDKEVKKHSAKKNEEKAEGHSVQKKEAMHAADASLIKPVEKTSGLKSVLSKILPKKSVNPAPISISDDKKETLNPKAFLEGLRKAQGKSAEKKAIKKHEVKKKKEKQKAKLKYQLELAGIQKDPAKVAKMLMIAGGFVDVALIIAFSIMLFNQYSFSFLYLLLILLVGGTIGYLGSVFIAWMGFYLYLDLRVYKRKVEIEKVLPDFLQLTSSNIKSGMPIDKALWLAVRPRFGVLAKEIEMVAKETMTGNDLEEALTTFSEKYESIILKRAISLIIEGLRSGGELGDLLNRISTDIQDSDILRKEMAANLTTYVIFISFATILAAPFLFGLATQLLDIVQEVTSGIDMPEGASSGMGMSLSGSGIAPEDFRIFAISMLLVTSLFSSLIIATINKGEIKAGLKYIPIFMITTVLLFFFASWMLGKIFGGMF